MISRAIIGVFMFNGMALATVAESPYPRVNEPNTATIELKQAATVSGWRIYLSDVARCEGSKAVCDQIHGIDLGQSPLPTRTGYVQKSTVENILDKELSNQSYIVDGKDSVRVEAQGVDVSIDDLRSKLQELVAEKSKSISHEYRINLHKVMFFGMAYARPTQSKIEFPELENTRFENHDWLYKNFMGNKLTQARIVNPNDPDDRSVVQIQTNWSIDRLMPVPRQSLMAGAVIQESDLAMEWVAQRSGPRDFALSTESIVGLKIRQSLSAGDGIPLRYLERPIAIARNQPVTLVVKNGDLEIASRATTVDQGSIGQTIDVVSVGSKRKIRAKVMDEKTVEAVAF